VRRVQRADLPALARGEGPPAGARWTLEGDGDLNANLVSFPPGDGVGEHVNEERDVLLVGVAGAGAVVVDGVEHRVLPGTLVLVPRGARRATRAGAERFSYLTVHRRRPGGIPLGP
jgi:quercetin dioxygenase-like cupin family protein